MQLTVGRPWVVKLGGRLVEDPVLLAAFAAACRAHPGPLVLVHGGGVQLSALQAQLGLTPQFVAGRRVTDAGQLQLLDMVLAGAVNKSLVRALLRAGRSAVGLSGCDGGLVRCRPLPDLGAVGVPERVDPSLLQQLLAAERTPVLAPISLAPDGGAMNVNADEFAAAIAGALHAERLLLLSDVPGVRLGGAVRAQLDPAELELGIQQGDIRAGMIPKVRAASAAVLEGVGAVHIAEFTAPLRDIGGTVLRALATEEEIREA